MIKRKIVGLSHFITKKQVILILFFTFFSHIYAQENRNNSTEGQLLYLDDRIITSISVLELKRTKPRVIEQCLERFIGKKVSNVDLSEVRAALEDLGVIEVLSIDIVDNLNDSNSSLQITAHDKWSFLAGPFFNVDLANWSIGAAVYEPNAFGLHDTIVILGTYGTKGWSASFYYESIPEAKGNFGFSAGGSFANRNITSTNQSGDTVQRRFNSMQIKPEAGISFPFTDFLTASLGLSYLNIILTDTETPVHAPSNGLQAISLNPGLSLKQSSWDGYLLSEKSVVINYKYNILFDGGSVHSLALDTVFNHSFLPGFRLISKGSLLFSFGEAVHFFESAPVSSVNFLSSSYSAADYAAFSLGVEKYLFKFLFGTSFTASLSYQAAYSNGELLRNQFDHGPVAGLQLYFSKIAIPGFLLGAAYNVSKNYFSFVFNMGIAL